MLCPGYQGTHGNTVLSVFLLCVHMYVLCSHTQDNGLPLCMLSSWQLTDCPVWSTWSGSGIPCRSVPLFLVSCAPLSLSLFSHCSIHYSSSGTVSRLVSATNRSVSPVCFPPFLLARNWGETCRFLSDWEVPDRAKRLARFVVNMKSLLCIPLDARRRFSLKLIIKYESSSDCVFVTKLVSGNSETLWVRSVPG